LELFEGDLVPHFIPSIVISLLLHSIISEMDEFVGEFLNIEFSTAGSYVAFIIAEAFEVLVDTGHHSKAPDIKLPLLVEQRVVNVLLEDKGPIMLIPMAVQDRLYLIQFGSD